MLNIFKVAQYFQTAPNFATLSPHLITQNASLAQFDSQ